MTRLDHAAVTALYVGYIGDYIEIETGSFEHARGRSSSSWGVRMICRARPQAALDGTLPARGSSGAKISGEIANEPLGVPRLTETQLEKENLPGSVFRREDR